MSMDVPLPRPLDSLFTIESGTVTSIQGPAGSGKTTIALLFAFAVGGPVAFVDTEGLSLERGRQLGGNLENLLVKRVNNFVEQSLVLKKLTKMKVAGIVVDSLVTHYRLELLNNVDKANRELLRQINFLSALAEAKKIPVLITNQVYTLEGETRSSAGDILKYHPKCIVALERLGDAKRRAVLLKHRSRAEGTSVKFLLTANGIAPVGLLG